MWWRGDREGEATRAATLRLAVGLLRESYRGEIEIVYEARRPGAQQQADLRTAAGIKVQHEDVDLRPRSPADEPLLWIPDAAAAAMRSFPGLAHRMQQVGTVKGIPFINDSKATNPHAASASIMSALSVIWIAGGLAKGATMGELVQRIKARVRVAILIGEDRELIATALSEQAPHIEIIRVDTPAQYTKGGENNALMEDVIRRAQERAQSGDTVLLAPACASMDQFLSYSDRGERFKSAVEKVVRDGK